MYTVGTTKPTSGYTVSTDSYLHRSSFGQIAIYAQIQATTVQNALHKVAFVEEGYRPGGYAALTAYVSTGNGVLTPVQCFVYSNGDIKIINPLANGSYSVYILGSYFIWN